MKEDTAIIKWFLIVGVIFLMISIIKCLLTDGTMAADLHGGTRKLVALQSSSSTMAGGVGAKIPSAVSIIRKAAKRNGIMFGSDNWFILLAIHKAENGRAGCEFGIKNPKAWNTNLDTQAGWCACTIIKNRERWDGSGDFIDFLADRYCPKSCDFTGNLNWKKNVHFWFRKFKGAK